MDPDKTAPVHTVCLDRLMLKTFPDAVIMLAFQGLNNMRQWLKIIQFLLNKTSSHFQLLPMSKVDKS